MTCLPEPTKSAGIQLPELSRAALHALYAEQEAAKQRYSLALNATLAALGLDPRSPNHIDLDSGVITPAAQE
jgi:hypothetical protein